MTEIPSVLCSKKKKVSWELALNASVPKIIQWESHTSSFLFSAMARKKKANSFKKSVPKMTKIDKRVRGCDKHPNICKGWPKMTKNHQNGQKWPKKYWGIGRRKSGTGKIGGTNNSGPSPLFLLEFIQETRIQQECQSFIAQSEEVSLICHCRTSCFNGTFMEHCHVLDKGKWWKQ